MDKTKIQPYEELQKQIYGYILPEVPTHDGYVKVGDTRRETKVRIFEQVGTAGLTPKILFERMAKRSDGKWFSDKDLHRFFDLNGIEKAKFGTATEWYFFNGYLQKAEELTDKFINLDYDELQIDDSKSEYTLRAEQARAVEETLEYYNSGEQPKEFLWNAKPRFGKTLTAYDFVRRIRATNVLIVTNRPAIANSWFDDFKKFIGWQEPDMKFISDTDALKGKAMSRDEFHTFIDKNIDAGQITFLSLQDLKGAKAFGGHYEKLQWIADLHWDLLIIDEAHEGVDTELTDVAFDKIQRGFTLHLSGTPFKALANNKFRERQIFNWSYVDEQDAKMKWNYINNGSNPYENLPELSLFTYQMSKMIEDKVSKGLTLDNEENVDYAFDLNEFFKADDRGKFEYEASVKRFLDNLCSGHFPFSVGRQREELAHTFWLLPRVNSAKAMEALLREHPVFKDYVVVLAAGDGVSVEGDLGAEAGDFKKNEKSFNKVRMAIGNNERTITLSVGQLTTGVTIPEWSAVLMLNNIKSPSLYFQAAFRAQNPYEFVVDGRLFRKEKAYIFDFAPERTLRLFDEFANNLSGDIDKTTTKREAGIKELLNFFPVIGEDEEGKMHELNAAEVLIIPTRITSREVVKRGFMSNLLFANISGIFAGHIAFKEILDKIKPEKNKRLLPPRDLVVTDPMLDDKGNVRVPKEIVINRTGELFGPNIYRVIDTVDLPDVPPGVLTNQIKEKFSEGFAELKKEFELTNVQLNKVKKEIDDEVTVIVAKQVEFYQEEVKVIAEDFNQKIEVAKEQGRQEVVAALQTEMAERQEEAKRSFADTINHEVGSTIVAAVDEQIVRVEEAKKKTTEDDVRDHLRGFARTIPAFLMAYGDENTTLGDFEKNIDEPTFEELTSITIDEFKKLRDGFEFVDGDGNNKRVHGLFNEVVFNASVREFFATKERLSNYFDETLGEDIFDYIPPQKTNQIFTPRRVVNMMVDMLEQANPGIFSDYTTKFLDPYVKSGLYMAEIVRRLHHGLEEQIPNSKERIKWILENQVYAIAPSNIIYNIVKNFIFPADVEISTKNLAEIDLAKHLDEANWRHRITEAFGGEDLKFDVIIGNPPYQELDGGGMGSSALPIYHEFVRRSKALGPKNIAMIVPSRWFSGGRGLDAFRDEMLTDKRIKIIHDFPNEKDVFPGVTIKGGVCYFLWHRDNHSDDCLIVTHEGQKIVSEMERPLLEPGSGTFIRFNEAIALFRKVQRSGERSFSDIVSANDPFGFDVRVQGGYKRVKPEFQLEPFPGSVKFYYNGWRTDGIGYVDRENVSKNIELIDRVKILIPKAWGIGNIDSDWLNPIKCEDSCCCTETYLVVGPFKNEKEMDNAFSYIQTKFFHALVSLIKISQNTMRKAYSFVPMQDFAEDWTDEKLYWKYGLEKAEVDFIERVVRPESEG